MVRVRSTVTRLKKKKKLLKNAKKFTRLNLKLAVFAKEQNIQAFNQSFTGRKLKKRIFKQSCISLINLFLKNKGILYSRFKKFLSIKNIIINSNILGLLIKIYPFSLNFLLKYFFLKE